MPSAATLWAGEAAELQPAGEARRAHSEPTPSSHLPRPPAPLLGFSTTPAAHSLQSPGSAAVPVWGWCPVLVGMWDQRYGAVFPCVPQERRRAGERPAPRVATTLTPCCLPEHPLRPGLNNPDPQKASLALSSLLHPAVSCIARKPQSSLCHQQRCSCSRLPLGVSGLVDTAGRPGPMQMFPILQGPGPLSLCAGSSVSLGPAVSPGARWPPEVIFQALTLQLVLRSYLALEP